MNVETWDGDTPADIRVWVCNYREGSSPVSEGALAYLLRGLNGDGFERRVFLVRSRGGRWIEKWEPTKRMTNWRQKTIPPEHPLYDRLWSAAFMQVPEELVSEKRPNPWVEHF